MRVFIAAQIPEKIKDYLVKIQDQLYQSGVKATWVKKPAMHLTLVFLGDINQDQTSTTAGILKKQSYSGPPINLQLGQLDVFPKAKSPKVIWISLMGEIDKLTKITTVFGQELKKEAIPFDPKPFIPHLTLGRLRRLKPQQRKQAVHVLKNFTLKQKPHFEISQINLIKSQLTSQGPHYTQLEDLKLT